jgi:hypothetical protein
MSLSIAALLGLLAANTAQSHLVTKPKNDTARATLQSQTENVKHARYVCRRGDGITRRWHCMARSWLVSERKETLRRIDPYLGVSYWTAIQIRFATKLAYASGADPWPNCPDPGPRDNQGPGHSWYDTVNCENGGNWLDSPGYYRCGLQFDPGWETHYGVRFCP